MVPLFYRHHPFMQSTDLPPVYTKEADLVVRPRISSDDRRQVTDLLEDAGFVLFEAPGYRAQPGTQYFQDQADGAKRLASSYIEFLAPLRGKQKEFIHPQSGLRSQALRYVDLLDHEPLEVDAQSVESPGIDEPCAIRLPHPATFILQKLLARKAGRS